MSGSLHAWYGLGELEALAERGAGLSGQLDISKLTRLASLLHSAGGSVGAALQFVRRRDGWLGVVLDYRARVQLVCQRCLEPFEHEIEEQVDLVLADSAALPAVVPEGFEPYELGEGRLQPAQLIEDELIVAIPLAPKHAKVDACGSLAHLVGRAKAAGR